MSARKKPSVPRSGFDKLASAYRWMEYAAFGPLLQRTRLHFLPEVSGSRRVLILGDGDGRFCVRLLQAAPASRVVAMDGSAAMLHRLRARAARAGVAERLMTVHGTFPGVLPPGEFDLVCTHFFLDCLSDAEAEALTAQVRLQCPRARWLVSEFAVPAAGPMRGAARLVVHGLYRAFAVLTGLRTQTLPDYAAAMGRQGFLLQARRTRAGGLLCSELWRVAGSAQVRDASHETEVEHVRPER